MERERNSVLVAPAFNAGILVSSTVELEHEDPVNGCQRTPLSYTISSSNSCSTTVVVGAPDAEPDDTSSSEPITTVAADQSPSNESPAVPTATVLAVDGQSTAKSSSTAAADPQPAAQDDERKPTPASPPPPPSVPAVIKKPPAVLKIGTAGGASEKSSAAAVTPVSDALQRPRGLSNLGNTCFFNACMQCLSQTPYLTSIFKDEVVLIPGGEFKAKPAAADAKTVADKAVVVSNGSAPAAPLTKQMPPMRIEYSVSHDELLKSFKTIMDNMQTPGGTISPSQFFGRFTNLHQQFGGGEQHDSHELLRHLLDSVLVAERRIAKDQVVGTLFGPSRKFRTLTPEEIQQVDFYARKAKDHFLIKRLFQGTLESTLRCEVCAHTSPNMETFLDISLPVAASPPTAAAAASVASRESTNGAYTGMYSRRKSPEPAAAQPVLTKRQLRQEKRTKKGTGRKAVAAAKAAAAAAAGDGSGDTSESAVVEVGKSSDAAEENSGSDADVGGGSDGSEQNDSKDANDTADIDTLNQTFGSFGLNRPEGCAVVLKKHLRTDDEATTLMNGISSAAAGSDAADPSTTIGLPYATKPNELSVQSCLNAFVAVELLSGANQVTCEACTKRAHNRLQQQQQQQQQNNNNDADNDEEGAAAAAAPAPTKRPPSVLTNATKQFLISSLPAVLILHLKRFQLGMRHRVTKIQSDVSFPLVLDMGPFCAASPQLGGRYRTVNPAQKRILYALYGVVVHQGQMGSGHYIAYVKARPTMRADDRRWKFVSTRFTAGEAGQEEEEKEEEKTANGEAATGEQPAAKQRPNGDAYDSDDSLSGEQLERKARAKRERESKAAALAAEEAQVQPPEGKWYCVSDSRVNDVSVEQVLKAQAYLLFYERIF